jgi:hypothetical protein
MGILNDAGDKMLLGRQVRLMVGFHWWQGVTHASVLWFIRSHGRKASPG